jgi:hypothetical protein
MIPAILSPSPRRRTAHDGFALVIALSLMAFVLLLLLSITTLVQVETRGAQTMLKKMESEQNATLGLYLALGMLQKEMGPDQRISANADLFSNRSSPQNDFAITVENPYLMGVWDSSGDNTNETVASRIANVWNLGDPINYNKRVTKGFRQWLVSVPETGSIDPSSLALAGDSSFRDGSAPDMFKALGAGTLQPDSTGALSLALEPKEVWAPIVDVVPSASSSAGRYSWVVLDEGVKARMNQVSQATTSSLQMWDSPGNFGIEAMGTSNEFDSFLSSGAKISKVSSFNGVSLSLGKTRDSIGQYYHDVSLYSKSVLSNVVHGGLKLDLSMLADERPSSFTSKRLYSDTNSGSSINAEADPHWSALFDFINLYKDDRHLNNSGSTNILPTAQSTQTDWKVGSNRASVDLPLPAPDTYRLGPSVSQVEMYLSLIALKPSQATRFTNSSNGGSPLYSDQTTNGVRQVFLCVAPAITLFNPYNVPLKLDDMWVVMRDPPIGVKFYLYNHLGTPRGNDPPVAMTNNFVAISQMIANWAAMNDGDTKQLRMSMKLTNSGTLEPGQSIVFSPQYADGYSVGDLTNSASNRHFELNAQPGYDAGVGIFWDQFTPFGSNDKVTIEGKDENGVSIVDQVNASQGNPGIVIIKGDRLKVAVNLVDGTQNPTHIGSVGPDDPNDPSNGQFAIELYGSDPKIEKKGKEQTDSASLIGRYIFDYNQDSLKNTSEIEREKLIAKSASMKQENYDLVDDGIVALAEITYQQFETTGSYALASDTQVKDLMPFTFAVFRAGAKVTRDEPDYAYHPSQSWAQTNSALLSGHYDIGEESPAYKELDLSLQVSADQASRILRTLNSDNSGYQFTGRDSNTGQTHGTQYEIPVTPLQSIANLQHANLFGGGYMPRVAYVVGNSWAHPLIDAQSATESPTTTRYGLFDHSYLSNARLWDRFYFSTLTDEKSILENSGRTMSKVVDDWLADGSVLNTSLSSYLPPVEKRPELRIDLVSGTSPATDAYQKIAAYQMLEGGFNINSTSIEAWKAVLSTSNIADGLTKIPVFPNSTNMLQFDGTAASTIAAAFSRYRIPNFNESVESTSNQDLSIWQGYRVLNESDITNLAKEIVKQVRYRGPFLSMAEFVNRRLSASTDARAQMGVIDAAIAASGLNAFIETAAGKELDEASDSISYLKANDYGMTKNLVALTGNTAKNIPTYLTQADILQQIGSKLTARSDTFVIRAYGEARYFSGSIASKSVCEAVVQRLPDYVDLSAGQDAFLDTNLISPQPDGLSSINERFGRRFKIVQFRWLDESEI